MEETCLWLLYNSSLQSWVRISSLICLFLTIAVYLFVNKLRNHLGMCLVFLLLCEFVLELYFELQINEYAMKLQKGFCLAAGYTVYFFLQACELWGVAFSYIIWKGLRVANRNDPGNRFLVYNIFVWGTAASLTAVIVLLDYYVEGDQYSKFLPGVGRYDCWLDTVFSDYAANIYIEFPRIVMDSYRVIMFTLTALHIDNVKSQISKFNRNDNRRTKLKSDKKNFLMLLRLFSIMAMSWSFSILYRTTEEDVKMAVYVMIIYFQHSFGIYIFALFILKRSTLRLLMERIRYIQTEWMERRQTA